MKLGVILIVSHSCTCRYVSVENATLKGTWLWTKVPMYFLYPPSIFQYTSLNFNYHTTTKQVQNDLTIQLPTACYNISTCSHSGESILHNRYLDVLTNEVSYTYIIVTDDIHVLYTCSRKCLPREKFCYLLCLVKILSANYFSYDS